jgi:hypothetical protein
MKILDQAMLSVLMVGSTHYVDLDRGADAVIYYETDKLAHMRLPGSETVLHGDLSMRPDGWFVKVARRSRRKLAHAPRRTGKTRVSRRQ